MYDVKNEFFIIKHDFCFSGISLESFGISGKFFGISIVFGTWMRSSETFPCSIFLSEFPSIVPNTSRILSHHFQSFRISHKIRKFKTIYEKLKNIFTKAKNMSAA